MKGFFYALLLRILFEAELTFLSVAYQAEVVSMAPIKTTSAS